jgi:hypothetical protein
MPFFADLYPMGRQWQGPGYALKSSPVRCSPSAALRVRLPVSPLSLALTHAVLDGKGIPATDVRRKSERSESVQTSTIKQTPQEKSKPNGGHPPETGQRRKTKPRKPVRSGGISVEQFLKLFH